MKLILIRHGESEANLARLSEGNSELSKLGVEQAERVAEFLRDEDVDFVYSSDLLRASKTAEKICEISGRDINFDERLREQSYGVLAEKSYDYIAKELERLGVSYFEHDMEGGESWNDVLGRVGEFFDEIYSKHNDETIMIVAHGVVIRCLLCYLFGEAVEESKKYKHKNTGVSFLDDVDGKWKINKLNWVGHLE